jgi:hypothetical protein
MSQGIRGRPIASEAVDWADKLLKELDAEVLIVGALGGVAASGGIVPPFTRLMMTFGGSGDDFMQASWKALPLAPSPPLALLTTWLSGKDESGNTVDPSRYAVAASGALEAMMMMTLMKNPGFLELIGKAVDKIPSVKL